MGKGGRCFVATAAYGSELAPEIRHLSEFRDRVLLTTIPGQAFVWAYYRLGPYLAEYIASRPKARSAARRILNPLVRFAEQHLRRRT